jgi:hypothetical protein
LYHRTQLLAPHSRRELPDFVKLPTVDVYRGSVELPPSFNHKDRYRVFDVSMPNFALKALIAAR